MWVSDVEPCGEPDTQAGKAPPKVKAPPPAPPKVKAPPPKVKVGAGVKPPNAFAAAKPPNATGPPNAAVLLPSIIASLGAPKPARFERDD